MSSVGQKIPILSTAGAIPVKNEKGELTMEKVKVSRYVTGKRPEYAPMSSDEEEDDEEDDDDDEANKEINNKEEDEEDDEGRRGDYDNDPIPAHMVQDDRRLKRLMERRREVEDRHERITSHRRLVEPEVLGKSDDEDEEEEVEEDGDYDDDDIDGMKVEGDASDAEELDEEEIERRREAIRNKLRSQKRDEDVLKREDETLDNDKADGGDDDEKDEEEEEEYSDDDEEEEEDEGGVRQKPVFVRKKDRLTLQERDKEEEKAANQEHELKKKATERRLQTLKLVDSEIKKDFAREQAEEEQVDDDFQGVRSDGENEAEEFESWKVRNLKYIKRDRDEKETAYKEKMELERIHHMTEEERRLENKLNPKMVTNKANKGKYKFLQKYYHRGVFYLDKEDTVYKRDFTAPTLEDHFNKTILPKVMQVKNFGRSGRTKYTHLVDQDTTKFEAAWVADTAMNLKFHSSKGAGMKQMFDKPSVKRKKVE